jgi:putative nucleotidyltransferase with HDIG domain
MSVHVLADSLVKLSGLRAMLEARYPISSALLSEGNVGCSVVRTIIIAADLRVVENIVALQEISSKIKNVRKRVFIIDQSGRLGVVQACALGATRVLVNPVSQKALLAALADNNGIPAGEKLGGAQEAASNGAIAISSMFSDALCGRPVDVAGAEDAARRIADNIAGDGLSGWLETVRQHHEGTYQHCLLVVGIVVDFGLSLGLTGADIKRLYSAAMFHDIGKAIIPLAILDKQGRLDPRERAVIETHPAAGYDVLNGTSGISPEVLDAVRHHHEYLDGSGYPDALCSENIADIVRMLTISDIFAALIEERRYKPRMPREQAYEIICGMQGKLELPLVNAFRDVALKR